MNYHEFLAAMVASRISLHDHLLKAPERPDTPRFAREGLFNHVKSNEHQGKSTKINEKT